MYTTKYMTNLTADTSRGPSQSLWKGCPWVDMVQDPGMGITIWDDFCHGGLITSPSTEAALVGLPYSGFGSSGGTITYADLQGGAIVLTEATTNEANMLRTKTCPFQISSNKGAFWFEARVKVSSITNIGMILGLWDDTTTTVDIPLSAADPPIMATTGNFVGFRMPEGAGVVNSVYDADDSGQTTDAEVVVQSTIATLVADTFVKLGMRFDPNDSVAANTLSFWVNGVRQTSGKVVPNATGTDFPADVRLGLLFGQKLVSTAAGVSTMDWWRAAQIIL